MHVLCLPATRDGFVAWWSFVTANLPLALLSSPTPIPSPEQAQLFSFNSTFSSGAQSQLKGEEQSIAETQLYLQGGETVLGGGVTPAHGCLCCRTVCVCTRTCAHVSLRAGSLAFWCLLCVDHLLWAMILFAGFCQKSYIYWGQTKNNTSRIWATFQRPSTPA